MLISGTGFDPFEVKIKPDFIPDTKLALQWFQLSNGEWACTDRLASADRYDVEVRLYGLETTINNFINQTEANRVAGSNAINLSTFNNQEHIFGADLNYSSSVSATAFVNRRVQGTWRGWGLTLTLKCTSPSFVGGSGSLPTLRFMDVGVDADADREINKFDSYNRTFSYQDHASDAGTFNGVFIFTDEEMIQMRRYVATVRGNYINMPAIIGCAYPFGRRSNPSFVRIKEFEDMGMFSVVNGNPRWRARIMLVESMVMP